MDNVKIGPGARSGQRHRRQERRHPRRRRDRGRPQRPTERPASPSPMRASRCSARVSRSPVTTPVRHSRRLDHDAHATAGRPSRPATPLRPRSGLQILRARRHCRRCGCGDGAGLLRGRDGVHRTGRRRLRDVLRRGDRRRRHAWTSSSPCLGWVASGRVPPLEIAIDFGGQLVPYAIGAATVAVPGLPAGVEALHQRWGRLPWADVVAPALEHAARGVAFAPVHSKVLAHRRAGDADRRGPPDVRRCDRRGRWPGGATLLPPRAGQGAAAACGRGRGGVLHRADRRGDGGGDRRPGRPRAGRPGGVRGPGDRAAHRALRGRTRCRRAATTSTTCSARLHGLELHDDPATLAARPGARRCVTMPGGVTPRAWRSSTPTETPARSPPAWVSRRGCGSRTSASISTPCSARASWSAAMRCPGGGWAR